MAADSADKSKRIGRVSLADTDGAKRWQWGRIMRSHYSTTSCMYNLPLSKELAMVFNNRIGEFFFYLDTIV
jgi:hypothetical protein